MRIWDLKTKKSIKLLSGFSDGVCVSPFDVFGCLLPVIDCVSCVRRFISRGSIGGSEVARF